MTAEGIEMQIPHNQEVFSNKFGTTKAVVCSCGFATTYTVMTNDADVMGMRHFKVSHEDHLARLEAQNAKLIEALEKVLEFYGQEDPLYANFQIQGVRMAHDALQQAKERQ